MENKNIILGVSGSIAAYKALDLTVSLKSLGNNIQVVMTEGATHFVTPMSFSALSGQKAVHNMWEETGLSHIAMAEKADLILLCPASANLIARLSSGMADDLLSATTLAATCPKIICPAMNDNMYSNDITKTNIEKLKGYGYKVVEPALGRLASGKIGRGRLAPLEEIIAAVQEVLQEQHELLGKTVVITAGGTREAIDPVRFISNRSSGKMGFALAREALRRGAQVRLISTVLLPKDLQERVDMVMVESADEMKKSTITACEGADALIMAAAVADYAPLHTEDRKIKKGGEEHLMLDLVRTDDIISNISTRCVKIGFAAETDDLITHAKDKLKRKNLDMIVANSVDSGKVFGKDETEFAVLLKDGQLDPYTEMSKTEAASIIIDYLVKLLAKEEN